MRYKTDAGPKTFDERPHFVSIAALCIAVMLCMGAACYGVISAATLSQTLYGAVSQDNKTATSLIFELLATTYHEDLRTLHLDVEAQGIQFDALSGKLTAACRQSGLDRIATVTARGTGYVNILDSRFMRGLTPNVDYNTVGSAYNPKAEGGTSLQRAVDSVAFEGAPSAYVVTRTPDGKLSVVTVLPLVDIRSDVIGITLVFCSSNLAAKVRALTVPLYLFSAIFGAGALLLAADAALRIYKRRRWTGLSITDAADGTPVTNPITQDN